MRGNIMKLRKQFSNLKKGAKKVFIGMLVLCLVSTATGIGSIFAYAQGHDGEHVWVPDGMVSNNDGTHKITYKCSLPGCEEKYTDDTRQDCSYYESTDDDGNQVFTCDCGYSYTVARTPQPCDTHTVTNWTSNGDGTRSGVCDVCRESVTEPDPDYVPTEPTAPTEPIVPTEPAVPTEPQEQHFQYTDNLDGTHAKTCTDEGSDFVPVQENHDYVNGVCVCGAIDPDNVPAEEHHFEYIDDENGSTHTKRCTDEGCSFKPVQDSHNYVDGVCVCGAVEPVEVPARARTRAFNAILRNAPAVTVPGLETSGEGPVGYLAFFSEPPVPAEGLVYNGQSQELFTSVGTHKTIEELADYNVKDAVFGNISITPGSGTSAINFGEYTASQTISYKVDDGDDDDSNDEVYTAIGTFTINIAKASFANDVTVTPTTSNYVETTIHGLPYYRLSINGTTLSYGTDFVCDSTTTEFDPVPKVGDRATVVLKAKNTNTNFDESTITKNLIVEDIAPTYNGSTSLLSSYHGTVEIVPPAGYSVSRTGATGSFVNKITHTVNDPAISELYYKYADTNKIIVKDTPIVIDADHYSIDELVTSYPAFYSTKQYTGSDIELMSTPPVLNEAFITAENLTVSWGFKDESGSVVAISESPKASKIGPSKYYFYVNYKTQSGEDEDLSVITPYETTIIKDIGHSDITYTAPVDAPDYQSLNSSTNLGDYYNVKDTRAEAQQQQLQTNVDYSVTVSPVASYYTTGTSITLTYTGLTNDADKAYYNGTTTKTIPVSTVNVLLNGKSQVSSYDDAVTFTANGYSVSDSLEGPFETKFEYAEPCSDYTLPLYFMKDGTSRIVKQDITNLNIGGAAAIKVLYDGVDTIKPYYFDSVKLSASGYTIATSRTGEFKTTYNLDYDSSKAMEPVTPFDLFFKDNTTGLVYKKIISGIYLYQTPTLSIKYNGDSLKDWYSSDVDITADNFIISDNASSGFKSAYTMSGSDVIRKKLYFKSINTPADVKSFMIVVAIDKTAPTGVINLASYSSNSFTTDDSVKAYVNDSQKASISSADDLSGVDYIHFYVSDTFYSSPSDVNASIKEKSGAWRTYSSSSQPTTVKDKNNYIYAKIVDKAGNENIISLGSIIYDTVAPKMTTAKVTASSNDTTKSLIGFAGTDKLSGINRFKYYYREKEEGRKYDTPDKGWMFDNGEYVKTSNEKDGTSVASTSIDVLDAAKTYLFYFIAVDRAGNISDVMTQEVKGDSAAAKTDMSSQGAAGKSGANGLTPSPSGIAGSGSGSGKQGGSGSSTSGSKSSKDKKAQSALGDKDREINRNPYIAEATGNVKIGINETSGWNTIASEVNKADKGAVIKVEMAGLSSVPSELFTSMNNRDVEVNLLMAEDVQWQIKGEEVPDARSDIDMGVRLGSRNIPEQIIADVAGTNPHVEFSINHNGDFGFVATIAVPVGESNKGMYTTLYHYDETKKELEVAGDGRVDDWGYAKFPLTHASDYTVVITPERILSAADADAQTSTLVGAETESQSSQYLDGARLRLTDLFRIKGSMRIWLFFIALLSATICIVILYLPALQSRNQNDQGDLF